MPSPTQVQGSIRSNGWRKAIWPAAAISRPNSGTPRLDYDARFARALAERPVSLGYYFIPEGYGDARTGVLPPPSLPAAAFSPLQPGTSAAGYGANLPAFQGAAQGAGFFNMLADADGTARQMNLVTPFGPDYYEALSASTLRVAYGGDPLAAGVERRSVLGRQYGRHILVCTPNLYEWTKCG